MKTAKWIVAIIATTALAFFIVQPMLVKKPGADSENQQTNKIVKKRYDDAGKLKADAEFVDGKRNGIATNYYKDGSIHSTINYRNDIKEGISTWYYQGGGVYRESPYVKGKIHGIQKKYYKNGNIMAEIPYNEGTLEPGTKEYTEKGKLKNTSFPEFEYEVINKTFPHKAVFIQVSGKNMDQVDAFSAFYISQNKKVKINAGLDNDIINFAIPTNEGDIKHIEAVIWLTLKTDMNNKAILEKKLNVTLGKI